MVTTIGHFRLAALSSALTRNGRREIGIKARCLNFTNFLKPVRTRCFGKNVLSLLKATRISIHWLVTSKVLSSKVFRSAKWSDSDRSSFSSQAKLSIMTKAKRWWNDSESPTGSIGCSQLYTFRTMFKIYERENLPTKPPNAQVAWARL